MKTFSGRCLRLCKVLFFVGLGFAIIGFMGASIMGSANNEYDFEESYDNIKNIEIEIDYGSLEIVESNCFKIEAINMTRDNFESYVDERGTWFIKDGDTGLTKYMNIPYLWNDKSPNIKIYIPAEIEGLNVKIGAGKLYANNLTVLNKTVFETGAGEIVIDKFIGKNVNIECGMGKVSLNGDITGRNNIECGMGNVFLNLDSIESDNNYYIDCGLGDVIINNSNYSFTTSSTLLGYNTDNEIKLECGIGRIVVKNR